MTSDNNNPDDRLNEALAEYMQRVDRGEGVDREAFLAEHADVADQLRDYFDDADLVERMAGPHAAETLPSPRTTTIDVPPLAKIRYFGDYELLEEIARGGMGVVYKARQLSLNRVVAVKLILAGQLASEADVKRFHAEAEAAANLDHPGIVPIFEIGQHDGQHYFSMGYVEGTSLAAKIAEGPLPPREAATLLKQVAEAVQYAHQQGVIHRDLKPANVLLDKQGNARVTDFGLAKRVQSASDLTGTGQILGTPSYMPPEQAAGKTGEIRETADVYALGAVLYAMLTGRPPFQADNPVDTLLQVKEREPVAPRQLNAKVPVDLETICLKCLEKDARGRYTSATSLAEDLGRYLNGEAVTARPVSRFDRCRRWLWRKRRIAAVVSAFAAGAALLAVVVIFGISAVRQSLVEDRARAFLRAVASNDPAALEPLLTERARELGAAERLVGADELAGLAVDNFNMGTATISGRDAHVPITLADRSSEYLIDLRLRHEAGEWRVYDVNLRTRGFHVAIDLENPTALFLLSDGGFGSLPEEKPLEAIDAAAFSRSWMQDFQIADQRAGDALDELAKPLGLTVVGRSDQHATLNKRITLERTGVSPLEAIEEICRQIGVHPRYTQKKLTLSDGPRTWPIAFAGPFLVEVTDVQQFAPSATGLVTLNVRAYGLPEIVVDRFYDRFDKVQIERVVDHVGRELHDPDAPTPPGSVWSPQKTAIEYPVVVPVKNLLRSVESIAELHGHVALSLPTRIESLRFDKLSARATKSSGDVRAVLQAVRGDTQFSLEIEVSGVEHSNDAQVIAYDETGRAIREISSFGMGQAQQLTYARRPHQVIVRFASELQPYQSEFRFQQLQLPAHEKMPETLHPVRFPGHDAPVTVNFVEVTERGDFTKVRLRAINHSDKAVRKIEMRHVYVDASGRALHSSPSDHTATFKSTYPPAIVEPGSTAEFIDAAFFMPEDAVAVTVTVGKVVFTDATEWTTASNARYLFYPNLGEPQ